jgi:hypothetical protein
MNRHGCERCHTRHTEEKHPEMRLQEKHREGCRDGGTLHQL